MPKTILVVDDEKDIVEMLRYNLEKEGFKVITASNGLKALEQAERKPNLIILDVMMPEMDGWQVFKELKKNQKTETIPVMFLTARGTETDEIVGLELGADDFLAKPVRIKTLIARIRSVFRKQSSKPKTDIEQADSFSFGELEINVPEYTIHISGKETFFPKKEFETLLFLVRNKGKVISREQLLNSVWGENVHVVDRTIDVHVRKIREKLGRYEFYIQTIKGIGYRFKVDP